MRCAATSASSPLLEGASRPVNWAAIGAAVVMASKAQRRIAALGLSVRAVRAEVSISPTIAAIAVGRGSLYPPAEEFERAMNGPLTQVIVTSVGHWRGEGLALVEAAG